MSRVDGWASRPYQILTEDQEATTPRFYQTKPVGKYVLIIVRGVM